MSYIGAPRREIVVEPVEEPIPTKEPVEVPDRDPMEVPVDE